MREVVALAEAAGAAILAVYDGGAEAADVTTKADHSPLTRADRRSHEVILAGLRRLTPEIPVVSEEGDSAGHDVPSAGLRWVVDPLDGTKEFLKRSGEFTVNIALVRDDRPLAGVVHAPVSGVTWVGGREGAWRLTAGAAPQVLRAAAAPDRAALRIVASRDHAGPAVRAMLARCPGATTLSIGSSLKFCLIAEGRADLYYRDGPTMEWDTAAAQAVLEAAGGAVCTLDGRDLTYGKAALRNPAFVALGDPRFGWTGLVDVVADP